MRGQKWRYKVRNNKLGRYAVRKGEGVSPPETAIIIWRENLVHMKWENSNFEDKKVIHKMNTKA